jgi:plasmid stability protein
MPTLQIRNVPDETHRELKARAARAGQSLSEYALAVVSEAVSRPTMEEIVRRARDLGPPIDGESGADAVRAERSAG